MRELLVIALAVVAVAAAVFLLMPRGSGEPEGLDWVLTATEARIIGGYGDNFAYGGENVRPIEGRAVLKVDTDTNEGTVEAVIRAAPESGPIVMARGEPLAGEIRLVWKADASKARYDEFVYLHGDTGNGAPVMPKLFNYLAGWAPIDVYVNGRLKYKDLAGHLMFSEGSRRPDGTIRKDDGTIYSPKLKAEGGFTDPNRTEFHLVAHTTEPDPENFPPHTIWIHLHFNKVIVEQAKRGSRPIPGY
jgi:hypothetical protein